MEDEIKLDEGYYIVKVTEDDMIFVGKISEYETCRNDCTTFVCRPDERIIENED